MIVSPPSSSHRALRDSIPVIFGYVPLGAAFGVLFNNLGYPWAYAGLMGLVIFAGAAQFMAIGLLAAHAGPVQVFLSTLVLNSRHIFYGVSLLSKYRFPFVPKLYAIFGLTDETYSLATSVGRDVALGDSYFLYLTALNHLYWVFGCMLGAFVGNRLQLTIPGLEFALTALFLVLSTEQFKLNRSPTLLVSTVAVAVLSLTFLRPYMLISSMLMACVVLFLFKAKKSWLLTRPIC